MYLFLLLGNKYVCRELKEILISYIFIMHVYMYDIYIYMIIL